jgi:hypothetical protein
MTTYTLTVKFERELEDDEAVIKATHEPHYSAHFHGAHTSGARLIAQFCRELQEAYDELGMAGHFQVITGPVIGDTVGHFGRCEFCNEPNVTLTARLKADPNQRICRVCATDKRIPSEPL